MKQQLILSLFLLISGASLAQKIDLQISITDSITNTPLPFVTVYLKKNGVGTTTNLDGYATISLSNVTLIQDTLICSYTSYKKEYIPIDIIKSERFDIVLKPKYQQLEEITISSKKQLTAHQILKKVLKNTPENYSNSSVNLLGLYRETFKENDKAVYLDEATVNIHYTKYPRGIFDGKDWEDWHYDDTYAFDFNYSQFDGFPNQFNAKDDRVQLIESRSTENWSKKGNLGHIVGGPLSITSKDYVKYQSDFLDEGNFDKYTFNKEGIETVNGKTCYVLHFFPNETGRKMNFFLGRKLNRSIYVGKLYVDKESFAVVKMEFQIAQNVDFGFYKKRIPLDYKVEIEYQDQNKQWSLSKIKLTQIRAYKMKSNNKSVLYESNQELFITEIISDTVKQIPDDLEWKHTMITTLRGRELPYNSEYWKNYEKSTYPELPISIQQDLSYEKTLEQQFNERFKQIEELPTPKADKIDFSFHYPQENINDAYEWFSNPLKSDEFYKYIEEENRYADNYSISFRTYQKNFFNSINNFYIEDTTTLKQEYKKGNIILDQDSLDNWVYYEYADSINRAPIFNRTAFTSKRDNCYILDIKISKNNLGILYTNNGGLNNNLILLNKGSLVSVDSISEIYSYHFLNDSIFYYTKENAIKRSDKLYCRNGVNKTETLIKTELDLTYDISLSQTKSYLFYTIESKSESEIYALDKNISNADFKLLFPRKENVYYSVKEFDGVIYALSNENAINNKILVQKTNDTWVPLVSHSKNTLITDYIVTDNYIVIESFTNSFREIKYKTKDSKKWKTIEFKSKFFNSSMTNLRNNTIGIHYSSPNCPGIYYEFDLEKELLKEVGKPTKIKLEFQHQLNRVYTERLWVKTSDGEKVPVTITRNFNSKKKHKGLILKVYGSYGSFPSGNGFSQEDQILINDGYAVAYAHVRGELTMGNQWYENGKLLNKENSFTDYIACAEYLIKKKYTDANHLIGYGQSAGGLVMGVVINRRPELFNTVILDHAYLDALTSMMNDSLPLTTDHYKEIGNPKEDRYYNYIKAYSPYENIKRQAYPNLLFIASSNDYQTPTSQIAKYVAKLREYNTGGNIILFKTDIGSGHIGSTIGNNWMKDLSFMNAFIYSNLFH